MSTIYMSSSSCLNDFSSHVFVSGQSVTINVGEKSAILLKCGKGKICGKIELTRQKSSSCALRSIRLLRKFLPPEAM